MVNTIEFFLEEFTRKYFPQERNAFVLTTNMAAETSRAKQQLNNGH